MSFAIRNDQRGWRAVNSVDDVGDDEYYSDSTIEIPFLLETEERAWRNTELFRADIELNKVQDGMGTGTVGTWREYRCALRNWPESEFFPDSTKRPVAPDTPAELPVGE